MNRALAGLGLTLAAAPCAYACYVAGWQVVSFAGFAVRLDDDLPGEMWRQIGFSALQMIAIAASLMIVWQGWQAGRYRKAAIALAVAWIGSTPVFFAVAASLRPIG